MEKEANKEVEIEEVEYDSDDFEDAVESAVEAANRKRRRSGASSSGTPGKRKSIKSLREMMKVNFQDMTCIYICVCILLLFLLSSESYVFPFFSSIISRAEAIMGQWTDRMIIDSSVLTNCSLFVYIDW